MSDLYEFVNGTELDPIYICNPDKSQCRGSELCHKPGGCFYTTDKDRALDPSTPLYMAESLKKVSMPLNKVRALCWCFDVIDKLKDELHATAEMHDDGDYYLRGEWVDEIFDKYRGRVIQMADCYDCKYAIGDYEEYYGGYRERIVVGCKLDRDPDTCGEEDDEDEMSEVRK